MLALSGHEDEREIPLPHAYGCREHAHARVLLQVPEPTATAVVVHVHEHEKNLGSKCAAVAHQSPVRPYHLFWSKPKKLPAASIVSNMRGTPGETPLCACGPQDHLMNPDRVVFVTAVEHSSSSTAMGADQECPSDTGLGCRHTHADTRPALYIRCGRDGENVR